MGFMREVGFLWVGWSVLVVFLVLCLVFGKEVSHGFAGVSGKLQPALELSLDIGYYNAEDIKNPPKASFCSLL